MTPYFHTADRVQKFTAILESWVGTPYRHLCGVKGQGCDCIHFVCRVLEEVGFAAHPYRIPAYPRDWHLHNTAELLLDGIRDQIPHREAAVPADGDILLFRFGKTLSHSAVYIAGYIYHSLNGIGVIKTRLRGSRWQKRIKKILCPMEAA
jgi:cell wall-associated NlpC family hydrolase